MTYEGPLARIHDTHPASHPSAAHRAGIKPAPTLDSILGTGTLKPPYGIFDRSSEAPVSCITMKGLVILACLL